MCGIAGGLTGSRFRELASALPAMTDALAHRGPDDAGRWTDDSCGIALGHRRLAVVDLSPKGHQPMSSRSGRYHIVFNGEIYNHDQIRLEIEKRVRPNWCGHSDTETLLEAINEWGVLQAIERCHGMFAFALWDAEERKLTLARDRMGEKPIYYTLQSDTFLFGSELKSLRAVRDFRTTISPDALRLLLRYNYIPAPYSIYEGVHKLRPGTLLNVTLKDVECGTLPEPITYWSVAQAVAKGRKNPYSGTLADAADELERLLSGAIGEQMIADVPLGAFLSGGVDSSAVVALMQNQAQKPVKTFTIGFHEAAYDEAAHAQAVARHLRTEHTQLYLTEVEAAAVIPKLPAIYDEPFSDSSQIPTFLVSKLARAHVTVSLSGDGGDELFAGYNRYAWGNDLWNMVGWMPSRARSLASRALLGLSPQTWDRIARSAQVVRQKSMRARNPGDKLHKLAAVLPSKTANDLYHNLVSNWKDPGAVVRHGKEPTTALSGSLDPASSRDFTERMMYLDQVSYLPDDILVKLDRAAMAVSLETRVPMLDHRMVEFAWTLPLAMKVTGRQTKLVLREVLYKYVPRELVERPKTGFGIPLDAFLRGALRDWAEALLDEKRLSGEGFFDPRPIREKWREHLLGHRNWSYDLWAVLMFQAWLENQWD
jgi:asparagine synthase (glutamine-hydrolysing)